MKILFIGDVVGKAGRVAVAETLPMWKKEHQPDFIIANAENSAHGIGATAKTLDELAQAGVEAFTLGDHFLDKDFKPMEKFPVVRPANLKGTHPGVGAKIFETAMHKHVLLISLLGHAFIGKDTEPYFGAADEILKRFENEPVDAVIVDFHAEATSEANALGYHLDGRVSAVVGTHTHVPTADGRILPHGTAYQSDVGMCGSVDSVIGFNIHNSNIWLRRELGEPLKKTAPTPADGEPRAVDAVLVDTFDRHKSRSITRLSTRA